MITGTARRNTEVSLMVISLVIAIGGYWLASLSRSPTVPAGIALYGVIYAAIYATAHLAIRKLAPRADSLLLPIALMLNAVGFVVIYRLEIPTDNVGLAAAQTQWLVVAIAVFIGVLWWVKDVRALARYRYTFALSLIHISEPTRPY